MEYTPFEVTREWIFDNRTPRGAWTRYQIEALGLTWPNSSGWIDELEGTLIDPGMAREFEKGKEIKAKVEGSDRKKLLTRVKRLNKSQLAQLTEFLDSIDV